MKLKKSVKRVLIIGFLLVLAGVILLIVSQFTDKKASEVPTVVNEIADYGYVLKSNKSEKYKTMFTELSEILAEDPVDEEKYVTKISEMFILDFFSLSDKVANTDVGGTDFVHSAALDNFLLKAEDKIYKFVQNNMYDDRHQELPTVDTVTVESVEPITFTALDVTDEQAYEVRVSWTYTTETDYQTETILRFMHEDKKLSLVEMEILNETEE